MPMQHTLALIKPDAAGYADEIIDAIQQAGFTILNKRRVRLSLEQTSDFYIEHYGKDFFPSLISFMSSGPVTALILAGEDGIAAWRELIGPTNAKKAKEIAPTSLRARFGTDNQRNALHGSDSTISANREIKFFFPNFVVSDPSNVEAGRDYLEKTVNPTLIRGLTALCKVKPETPIRWLADWLEENNPNTPTIQEPED
eukprot:TRINITY_DN8766_c0_g1_i2.p1 TRINITY_DN8766_c0_g1~~TRINITY_DN8766_c0_g1_i2.p1  ORF type:complete len:199 (+),score=13.36 TRINITY_DN8766_c0_g1_i2:50-646(+)